MHINIWIIKRDNSQFSVFFQFITSASTGFNLFLTCFMCIQAINANEDLLPVPETETDQAKLVLELQKENRELRMQLARQHQKIMTLQAHSSAPPTPPSATSLLSTPPTSAPPSEKRRTRPSLLAATHFTPEAKNKGDEVAVTIRTLQQRVKALEAELERVKKDYSLQLKQKDDVIRELSQKGGKKVVATRASLRPKEANTGELKSPSYRFRSPVQTAKKRSFWDITTANSPSVTTLNGRKTRSHLISEPTAHPSMLLQVQCLFFFSLLLILFTCMCTSTISILHN